MKRPARLIGSIACSPVPHMGVHDGDVPSFCQKQGLIRVRCVQIGEYVLGEFVEFVSSWHKTGGSVYTCKIIKKPYGIGYPVAKLVGNGSGIGMQGLRFGGMGIGGAIVEAAQFEAVAEDCGHSFEDARVGDDALKHGPFVDQVCEANAAGLLFEF